MRSRRSEPPESWIVAHRSNGFNGHPVEHLKTFAGILQADIYAGCNALYAAGRLPGPVTEVGCWAHSRRKFFDLADIAASKRRRRNAPPMSPLALQAVKRIDLLFDIERGIVGKSPEERLAVRRELSAPVLADLKEWMETERRKLSKHAPVAKAMDYMLKRWTMFARFLDDGRICLTNNAAERVVVQRARPREHDARVFKYVGVAGVDRPRIVQVGISGPDPGER